MKETVEYYIEQGKSENPASREASAHCIGELARKLDKEVVKIYIINLLDSLLQRFHDPVWNVREAVCSGTFNFFLKKFSFNFQNSKAIGNIILSFPEEIRPKLDQLYKILFDHIADSIWCIRENVSISIGNLVEVYGSESLDTVKIR